MHEVGFAAAIWPADDKFTAGPIRPVHQTGGVLLMGYELYRLLANKKQRRPRKNAASNKKKSATGKRKGHQQDFEVVDLEDEEDSMEGMPC